MNLIFLFVLSIIVIIHSDALEGMHLMEKSIFHSSLLQREVPSQSFTRTNILDSAVECSEINFYFG